MPEPIHTWMANVIPLGARVRRGPDWVWNDQDEYSEGYIVEKTTSDMHVRVVWPSGHTYSYHMHSGRQDLFVCATPEGTERDLAVATDIPETEQDFINSVIDEVMEL